MQQIKKQLSHPLVWGQLVFMASCVLFLIALKNPQWVRNFMSRLQFHNPLTWHEQNLRLEPEAQACRISRQEALTLAAWNCLGTATNYKTNERVWDVVYQQDLLGIFVLHDSVSGDSGRYDVQCQAQNVKFLAYLPSPKYDPKKSLLEQKFDSPPFPWERQTPMDDLPQILKEKLLATCEALPQSSRSVSSPSLSPVPSPSIVPIPPASAAP